jgi:hypothetical protein
MSYEVITGQDLFNMFRDNLLACGVDSDHWEVIEQTDRDAWNRTAEQVLKAS